MKRKTSWTILPRLSSVPADRDLAWVALHQDTEVSIALYQNSCNHRLTVRRSISIAPRPFGGPPPFGPPQGQPGFQQRGPPAPGGPMPMMGGPAPSFVPQGQQGPPQMMMPGGQPPMGGFNPGFGAPSSFPSGSHPGPGLPAMGGQMSPTSQQFGAGPNTHAPSAASPTAPGSGPMINPQRAAALGLR